MTRLPINMLLYAAIVGLLAGIGLQVKAGLDEGGAQQFDDAAQRANIARFTERFDAGKAAAGEVAVGPNYATPPEFWSAFSDVNLIGREPPPKPDPTAERAVEAAPTAPPKVPLQDLFVIEAIVRGAEDGTVVLQYKPAANVRPPEKLVAASRAIIGDTVGGSGPNPSRAPRAGAAFPTAPGGGLLYHQLRLDPTDGANRLWEPHSHIMLVDLTAAYAVFQREDPTVPPEQWEREKIYPDVLGLSQEVLQKLADAQLLDDRSAAAGSVRSGEQETVTPAQPSGWQAMAETVEIEPNRFNVGTDDREVFRRDPNRIFNQDIGTATWRSSSGSMTGVQITSLAPGYERYGVQRGDIIVAINGEPVSGKSEAIQIGKRLYKRGVRSFDVDFLSNGRRITRTYIAPDE